MSKVRPLSEKDMHYGTLCCVRKYRLKEVLKTMVETMDNRIVLHSTEMNDKILQAVNDGARVEDMIVRDIFKKYFGKVYPELFKVKQESDR